jgi:signal transduction histidine kinase
MMLQAVAHDVKNKLAELAMRLMETDIEAAALALDAADQISQALLLDDPNQLTTQIDSAAPADLVEELAAVYAQLFPEKIVEISVTRAPLIWYYDVALMRLALSNAVHNAFKHCDRIVNLSVYENEGMLIFEVRNDGAEFPAKLLQRNWNDAGKHSNGKPNIGYGTGMGLLLIHKITQAHVLEKDGRRRCGLLALSNEGGAVARLILP